MLLEVCYLFYNTDVADTHVLAIKQITKVKNTKMQLASTGITGNSAQWNRMPT